MSTQDLVRAAEPAWPECPDAVLRATRELLWVSAPTDARTAAERLITSLGGVTEPANVAGTDALPVDVSFGDGEVVLPSAQGCDVTRMLLERHLPGFVRDAQRALELAARTQRLAEEADFDPLTGLATRRVLGRSLGRLKPDDVVILMDLDHFKALNDTAGHAEGDRVLRVFGRTLAGSVRARDVAARFGGEEFVLVVTGPVSRQAVEALLDRVRTLWEQQRPHPVSFSAGIARAGTGPADQVLTAADEAMYAAKQAGRDRWLWAGETPDTGRQPSDGQADAGRVQDGFVAWSRLTVPEAGHAAVTGAFRARLGAVDDWPGFRRLEVWQDSAEAGCLVMVSWWDDEDAFRSYMASDDHRRSHARIPAGPDRPRAAEFRRFKLVST